MGNNNKPINFRSEGDLKSAIATVEQFQNQSPLVVVQAIDTLKRSHLFIQKLMQGDSAQQQLAKRALEAANRLDAHIEAENQRPLKRITRALYGILGFPKSRFTRIGFPFNPLNINDSFLVDLAQEQPDTVLNREADVIRMKAMSLLSGLQLGHETIRHSSIQATLDSGSCTSKVCLTIDICPGMSAKVVGTFKRDKASTPIAKTFQCWIKSNHSGYPFPSQASGWGFCDAIIPTYPYNLDQLPLFRVIYNQKQELARSLLSDNELLANSKRIQIEKSEFIRSCRDQFVQKHKELCLAIVTASGFSLSDQMLKDVSQFFEELQSSDQDALEVISSVWESVNEHCLLAPHQFLQEYALSERNDNDDLQLMLRDKSLQSLANMDASLCGHHLVVVLSESMMSAAHELLLQHWSEVLEVESAPLSDFAKKLQLAAFNQLTTFIHETQTDYSESINILDRLTKDERLFSARSFDHIYHSNVAVVHELSRYF